MEFEWPPGRMWKPRGLFYARVMAGFDGVVGVVVDGDGRGGVGAGRVRCHSVRRGDAVRQFVVQRGMPAVRAVSSVRSGVRDGTHLRQPVVRRDVPGLRGEGRVRAVVMRRRGKRGSFGPSGLRMTGMRSG